MLINEFLNTLELFFPYKGSEENKLKVFDMYVENLEGICISNKCEYDWKKVIMAIQKGYKKREFPLLADIINFLPEGKIIKPYRECIGEGNLFVVTLPNGAMYSYYVSAMGKEKEKIIDDMKLKYGTCDIKSYPKGSCLIGRKVITPADIS